MEIFLGKNNEAQLKLHLKKPSVLQIFRALVEFNSGKSETCERGRAIPVEFAIQLWARLLNRDSCFCCFFITRKDIFHKREDCTRRGKDWSQGKALDCRERNEDKILFLSVKLRLKDGGGICRGTSFLISNSVVHQLEEIITI